MYFLGATHLSWMRRMWGKYVVCAAPSSARPLTLVSLPRSSTLAIYIPPRHLGREESCVRQHRRISLEISKLIYHYHHHYLLPESRTGFRQGSGTGSQVFYVIIIETCREYRGLRACFIDYSKAFDCEGKMTGRQTGEIWKPVVIQRLGGLKSPL